MARSGLIRACSRIAASIGILVWSAELWSAPLAVTRDDEPTLEQRIASLETRISELQAAQSAAQLDKARCEVIRDFISDVLADADTRSGLLQGGPQAGWDKSRGFFIASPDGGFLLKISGQLQARAVYNHQENSSSDDNRFGFEIRRAKLFFFGNIIDPSWEYLIELDLDRSTGNGSLGEDGWIQKNLGRGFKVLVGQFKPRFVREEFVSSKRLFNVERTLVNSQFTTGISQGALLTYEQDRWRAFAAVHDGRNAQNGAWNVEDTEYAFAGRAEWLAAGDWSSMSHFTGFPGTQTSVLVGVGADYEQAEYGTGSNLPLPDFNNAEVENLSLTADVSANFNGASAAAAVIYRNLRADSGVGPDADLDQIAFFVRGGVFIAGTVELVAQYEWGDLDIDGIDELSIVTVGVNKYFDKHNIKWQTDVGYGLNGVASQWASSGAGWRGDSPNEDGQTVVRSQIQLLF